MLYIVGPPRTKKQKGKKPGDLTAMLNAEARRARFLQSYKKFVAGLKAKKWQSSACRLAENTPLGRTAALTEFRRYPCKLRHPKVSVYSWRVKTKGAQFADAHAQRVQRKMSDYLQSPTGRDARKRAVVRWKGKQIKAKSLEQS